MQSKTWYICIEYIKNVQFNKKLENDKSLKNFKLKSPE